MRYFLLFIGCWMLWRGDCNSQKQQTAANLQPPVALDPVPVTGSNKHEGEKMNGLTFVAPPEVFTDNPMLAVTDIGASWISVIPYAFTRIGTPAVRYGGGNWQWWGESPEGVKETIRKAHAQGIKVMLKPQVYVPRGWTGTLDFPTDTDWEAWERGYDAYITTFAAIADTLGVEVFCIGTEFNNAITKRPQYWLGLIDRIKAVYRGKLTYSSNWDDWDKVPFWAKLDFIGLGGYFPLVSAQTPAVSDLVKAWQPIKDRLKTYSDQQKRPVLFTEFGYLSVDSCGWRNWELERGIEQRTINQQAQSNCYEAIFSVFQPEPWWAGSFLWKWFPNMRGHEGYPERDYTPQGKLGAETIRKWYKKQ